MDIISKLKRYNERKCNYAFFILPTRLVQVSKKAKETQDKDLNSPEKINEEFQKLYIEWKGLKEEPNGIPRFYYKIPAEDNILLLKLREESRNCAIARKKILTFYMLR
ncbi:serine/threonine-protein phosphatase 2A regulatory subunit B'' subunit gamma-like isoform X2 [Centruroides sculpturatus]|uniref:serine/threonine-protein phosphatase 2A regulatory subunit B'' subunit gamma-like isoform X2 n=1 Tax=Centruroides sculpturatus TaxID=218467 RepID=UPI000C6E4B38|nr:serine/threonine-protein phosphatase 2A regulatory subunit B'' subunit gamma-like isoform X2 [Centruroides sculpturatus]